jgi:hypothetical protein
MNYWFIIGIILLIVVIVVVIVIILMRKKETFKEAFDNPLFNYIDSWINQVQGMYKTNEQYSEPRTARSFKGLIQK